MTTPEQHDPVAAVSGPDQRVTRPVAARSAPHRKPITSAAAQAPTASPAPDPAPEGGVRDPDALVVNEAIADTVRTAYDVLSDTIGQGRKAAEQFRAGAYNVRDVPDDVRHMAANLLGLAKQLSSATFDICEALLRQTDTLMTPPPPGSTPVPPFQEAKPQHPAPHSTRHPGSHPISGTAAPAIQLNVLFDGKRTAKAHTATLARPDSPTGADQISCDGLVPHGISAPPIARVAFETNAGGLGLTVMVFVPQDQPAGVYSGAVHCATQSLPLGQLVVEIA